MLNFIKSTKLLSIISIIILALFSEVLASEAFTPKKPARFKKRTGNDIFRPIAVKEEAARVSKKKSSQGVVSNLFEWAHQFKSQIKDLFGIKNMDTIAPYRNQFDKKVVINILGSKVHIAKHANNKVESRVIGWMKKDTGVKGQAEAKLANQIKQAESKNHNLLNVTDDFLDHVNRLENAVAPIKKQKKRGRKTNNLVLEKFGIGKEVNLKESYVPVEEEVPRRNTRLQQRYANQNVDELFTPIKIVWEVGTVKKDLEAIGKGTVYSLIKQLLTKATAIIQSYVRIDKTESEVIEIKEGKRCGFLFERSIKFETHLVMLVRLFEPAKQDKAIIARSIFCAKTENNRATIGVLNLNIKKLVSPKSSITRQRDFLNTIVHETLHTLAFHANGESLFFHQAIKLKHKNLSLIKRVNPQIYDEGHWLEEYLPNDLMGPYTKSDTIFSIFSIELLEHQSEKYAGQRKNLVANPFFSSVESVEDFFNYKCIDSVKPKYDIFCSKHQVANDHRLCSKNYVFQTFCDDKRKKNNCFLKSVLTAGNCMDPVIDPNFTTYQFEHRGSNSRCFLDVDEENSYCLKYEIADKKVNMILGKMVLECNQSFQIHNVIYRTDDKKAYELNLKCPDINDFVAQHFSTTCPQDCHNNGFCSNGQCICFNAFDASTNCRTLEKNAGNQIIFSEVITQ